MCRYLCLVSLIMCLNKPQFMSLIWIRMTIQTLDSRRWLFADRVRSGRCLHNYWSIELCWIRVLWNLPTNRATRCQLSQGSLPSLLTAAGEYCLSNLSPQIFVPEFHSNNHKYQTGSPLAGVQEGKTRRLPVWRGWNSVKEGWVRREEEW